MCNAVEFLVPESKHTSRNDHVLLLEGEWYMLANSTGYDD